MRTRLSAAASLGAMLPSEEEVAQVSLLPVEPPFERGADPDQLEVIRHEGGPLAVFAGAGSGKTFALVRRVARLVGACGVEPSRIFCVTFSNAGVCEMNERLKKLGVPATVQTWHAFCLRVLKQEQTREGSWTVEGEPGSKLNAKLFLKKAIGYQHENWVGADLSAIRSFIGICKANLWAPEDPETTEEARKRFRHNGSRAVRVYAISESLVEEAGFLLFDNMLTYVARLFRDHEDVRASWAAKFDHVMQDEAQDASVAQVTLARMLAKDHRNYMIVGDPSQAIYGFRGSSPKYIADFPGEWSAKVVTLATNYRSCRRVVATANDVIRDAPYKLPKDMVAARDLDGKVEVVAANTLDDEAEELVAFVKKHAAQGNSVSDVAVLYRTNAQSRALEQAFLGAKIPHVIIGNVNFYERKEVKDLLAYLRLAAGADKEGDAVKRCINAPFRFLGNRFVEKVQDARDSDPAASWQDCVLRASNTERIQDRQRRSALDWVDLIAELRRMIDEGVPKDVATRDGGEPEKRTANAHDVLSRVVARTRYIDWLEKEEGEESIDSSHAANVREMLRVSAEFPTVADFLAFVDKQVAESRKNKQGSKASESVTLMSVHRCVSPSTLVETAEGVLPIADIAGEGSIATAEGAASYRAKVRYEDREMLRLVTKSGYSVEVTTDHGMMVWSYSEGDYVQKKAEGLVLGDFLRLRLGATIDVANAELPPLPSDVDVRAKRHVAPERVDAETAEFFGLMVADGTVFRGGFRLKKRHADVSHRFADLAFALFGTRAAVERGNNTYDVEVCSTQLSKWLLSIGGMAPKQKRVPVCVLRSSLRSQAAFLRGLFEDGTVNVANDRLDHVSWSTCYPEMAKVVQTMLLRQGIISARKPRFGQWRVEIYGANAHKFRDAIGFVSGYKNGLLQFPTGAEEGYLVPVTTDRLSAIHTEAGTKARSAKQNGKRGGTVSRAGAVALGGFDAELVFHHERVVRIEKFRGPAMCVEVPRVGRFLQDGFDGCNSKGLEWPVVWIVGCVDGVLPHAKGDPDEEQRLFYVAATRARDHLVCSFIREMATRAGVRTVERSKFLDCFDAKVEIVVEGAVPDAAFDMLPGEAFAGLLAPVSEAMLHCLSTKPITPDHIEEHVQAMISDRVPGPAPTMAGEGAVSGLAASMDAWQNIPREPALMLTREQVEPNPEHLARWAGKSATCGACEKPLQSCTC